MAELEIHMEGAEGDPSGKKIGVLAAVIAVLLTVVTILSHRAHADAVVFKAEAGDQWAFYQAKSIKSHALAVGRDLLRALGTATAATEGVHARYEQERKRYEGEAEEIKREALARGAECPHAERQALRYDVGEGLLEIGPGSVFALLHRPPPTVSYSWVGGGPCRPCRGRLRVFRLLVAPRRKAEMRVRR